MGVTLIGRMRGQKGMILSGDAELNRVCPPTYSQRLLVLSELFQDA